MTCFRRHSVSEAGSEYVKKDLVLIVLKVTNDIRYVLNKLIYLFLKSTYVRQPENLKITREHWKLQRIPAASPDIKLL